MQDHQSGFRMRVVSASLAIVLLAQLSAGAKCPNCESSDSYLQDNLKGFMDFTKSVMQQSAVMVNAVIAKMPDTEEYQAHRATMEAYIYRLEQKQKHKGRCASKGLRVLGDFLLLIKPLETAKGSVEAIHVLDMMREHGLRELETDIRNWMKIVGGRIFQAEYEKAQAVKNATSVSPLLFEIC